MILSNSGQCVDESLRYCSIQSGHTCVVTTFQTKGAVDGAVSHQRRDMRPGRHCDVTGPAQLGNRAPLGGDRSERRETLNLEFIF